MLPVVQRAIHWRDRAIAQSEVVSDAWQVFLAWTGRGAEIVLFICMAISLVEMIPTISLPDLFTGSVFVVQMITLDIAGFGLTSLANSVKRAGDEKTAKKAGTVGTLLIAIMVVSLLSGGIDRLFDTKFPVVKDWMLYLDDALILVRVGMTVFYGKIMHALRDSQQEKQAVADETETKLREDLTQAQADLQVEKQRATDLEQRLQTTIIATKDEQAGVIGELQHHLADVKSDLETKAAELLHVQNLLSHSQQNESFLQASLGEKELSLQAKIQTEVEEVREQMKVSMEAEMEVSRQQLQAEIAELKRVNSQLKVQMKEQTKTPIKQAKQVQAGKFDTRQFVFSCLQQNSKMKFLEMAQLAKKQGQELSEPTVSRYRKEYRETFISDESGSSAMDG